MRNDIIDYLGREIKHRCESENNFFGIGCYYHICAVVQNAFFLAEQYGADQEIVIIAAWLHDVASITDYSLYEEHHIHGAEMAGQILKAWDYDEGKIEIVKNCIINHRGSELKDKNSLEEICVADADAISHFDSVPSLFYLAYVNRKLGIEEGMEFVKNKLQRSFNKLSDRSKVIYKEKYDKCMKLLVKGRTI